MPSKTHVCFVSLAAYPLFEPSVGSIFGGSEVRAWLLGTELAKWPGYRVSFVVFDHGQRVSRRDGVTLFPHSVYARAGAKPRPRPVRHLLRPEDYAERLSRFPFIRLKRTDPASLAKLPLAVALWLWRRLRRPLAARRARPVLSIDGSEIGPEMWGTYKRVDADVYCVFGVGNGTAEVVSYCRKYGKKFVLFCGTDEDLSRAYRVDSKEVNAYGSRGDVCHYVIVNADRI